MSPRTPLLTVSDLVAGYEPGLPIVNGAGLELAPGEILTVLGPNGAGKSTLVKAVAGLVPVFSGRIAVQGADITAVAPHARIGRGIAFVPQTENVFARLTVADNLRIGGDRLPARLAAERVAAMYAMFPDLAAARAVPAGRLSGGQRQMLAIARALVAGPAVLMLDEPSAGLSPKMTERVFARLAELKAAGVAILLVEQNVKAALALADRALVLVEGRNRCEAAAADLAGSGLLGDLFLGRAAPSRPVPAGAGAA